MVVGGAIGTLAATALTLELINSLRNPHYIPVCNLNPIFSCSSVMQSHQAQAFGFPNEIIGIAGFAAVAAIGVATLAGGRFKPWLWKLVNLGLLGAVAFITWLQFETLYRIGALCIFCMVTWVVTIPLFWYVSLYNLQSGHISFPKPLKRLGDFFIRHHTDALLVWFLVIIALVLKRFWYYFGNI